MISAVGASSSRVSIASAPSVRASGLQCFAAGAAVVTASPDASHLLVSNLGGTGRDGVDVSLSHLHGHTISSASSCGSLDAGTQFSYEWSCRLNGLPPGEPVIGTLTVARALGRAPREVASALRDFGLRAGTTFQIADDLLDFESDTATLGKAVLADVSEGKPSLPLAIALKRLPPLREEMASLLRPEPEASEDQIHARVRAFAARLSRTGALGAARRIAEKERDAALAALERVPQGPTRDLLAHVARALLSRSH